MSNLLNAFVELVRMAEYKFVASLRHLAASCEYAELYRGSFNQEKAARLIKREGMIEHLHLVINDYPGAQERLRELEIEAIMEYHYRCGSESRESILDEFFAEELCKHIKGHGGSDEA